MNTEKFKQYLLLMLDHSTRSLNQSSSATHTVVWFPFVLVWTKLGNSHCMFIKETDSMISDGEKVKKPVHSDKQSSFFLGQITWHCLVKSHLGYLHWCFSFLSKQIRQIFLPASGNSIFLQFCIFFFVFFSFTVWLHKPITRIPYFLAEGY